MNESEYANKERQKAVTAVYLLLQEGSKLLFALRKNTGYQDGNWNVPSGHVERDELPIEALIREAGEEIGIDLSPDDVELVHTSYRPAHDPTGPRIDLFFSTYDWRGEIVNAEPHKCAQLAWFRPQEMPENTTPHVRNAIECAADGIMFSELSLDWLKERGLYKL